MAFYKCPESPPCGLRILRYLWEVLWGRSVRRECPSGVGLQTIWIMSASALPSTLSNAALELGMIL